MSFNPWIDVLMDSPEPTVGEPNFDVINTFEENINIFGGGIAGTKNEFFGTKCRKINLIIILPNHFFAFQ